MAKRTTTPDEEMIEIPFLWVSASPDPVQYKPYNPQFEPMNVIVRVPVPARFVLDKRKIGDETYYELTPNGMAYASKELAKAVMRGHSDDL